MSKIKEKAGLQPKSKIIGGNAFASKKGSLDDYMRKTEPERNTTLPEVHLRGSTSLQNLSGGVPTEESSYMSKKAIGSTSKKMAPFGFKDDRFYTKKVSIQDQQHIR